MPFVIYKVDAHGRRTYVQTPGAARSYKRSKTTARRFPNMQAAHRDCCGNEHIEEVHDDAH